MTRVYVVEVDGQRRTHGLLELPLTWRAHIPWPRPMTAEEIRQARWQRAPFTCDDVPEPEPRRSRTALGSGVVVVIAARE